MKRTVLFFLVVGMLVSQSRYSVGESKSSACVAARANVDYGSGLSIPEATKARIETYRAGWKDLCDGIKEGRPSLAVLFTEAKQIEADFKKVFEDFDESILNDTKFDSHRSDAVNDLVSKQYPAFVPAFKGAYGELEIFSPSVDAFRVSSPLGDSADRLFFESGIPLTGDFPPYVTRTWDYGGCDRFGDFDWTEALKNIAKVKKKVRSEAYLSEASQFEENLFRELGTSYDICTCKEKEAVLKDLLRVQKYMKQEPAFLSNAPKVQQTIDSIQSGRIKVNSEMEKHCSGG